MHVENGMMLASIFPYSPHPKFLTVFAPPLLLYTHHPLLSTPCLSSEAPGCGSTHYVCSNILLLHVLCFSLACRPEQSWPHGSSGELQPPPPGCCEGMRVATCCGPRALSLPEPAALQVRSLGPDMPWVGVGCPAWEVSALGAQGQVRGLLWPRSGDRRHKV